MRVFVAVDLTDRVRREMTGFAGALASRLVTARVVRPGALAWVAERHLHLTLRFVGEVDEETGLRLAAAMAPPFAIDAFEMVFDRLGVFPAAGPPRVIWLGVAAGAAGLADLAGQVEGRLRREGIAPEMRPFSPHLTLARFKQPPARGTRDEIAAVAIPHPFGPSRVDRVTLYESRLSPSGPAYRAVARAPLGRPSVTPGASRP